MYITLYKKICVIILDQELSNLSHVATYLVLVGATLFKKPKAMSFQIGSGKNSTGLFFM